MCFVTADKAVSVNIPGRSRFEVPAATGSDLVYFETIRPLDLIPYSLDAVQVQDGVSHQDYSKANEQGTSQFRPLGWIPQRGNALYLGFKPKDGDLDENGERIRDPQFPGRLVLRIFLPPPSPTAQPRASRGEPPRKPPQTLVWEYRSRLDLAPNQKPETLDRWRPLAALTDETLALTREGYIELQGPGPDTLAALGGRPTPDDKPRYWLRARLADGVYPSESVPEIAFVRANVVDVEALATFNEEVLGESDGFQQEYTLSHTPVDPESLTLDVEVPGVEPGKWTRKDDFLSSNSGDSHYILNPTSGVVRFGDGRNGQLPPPGGLVVARTYRAGGGAAGNVPAGTISSPPANVAGVDSVTNPRPATGGRDEESLQQLQDRAPLALRGDSRAVTADDYRRFAEQVAGVAKASVLPLYHPEYPSLEIPGAVTVVVAPSEIPLGPDGVPLKPVPTQDLLDRTAIELNQLRALGSELYLTGPDYREIAVLARVRPADGASDAQVKQGVKQAIEDYLAPVRRQDKPQEILPRTGTVPRPAAVKKPPPAYPQGWPFGEPFYPSRLYEVILSATDESGTVRLVKSVAGLRVTVDGVAVAPELLGDAVPFAKNQLPFCTAQVEFPDDREEGRQP